LASEKQAFVRIEATAVLENAQIGFVVFHVIEFHVI